MAQCGVVSLDDLSLAVMAGTLWGRGNQLSVGVLPFICMAIFISWNDRFAIVDWYLQGNPSSKVAQRLHFTGDGGWLLHQVNWTSQSISYIIQAYVKLVFSRFNRPTVVFLGYGNIPSTKDHEHVRRIRGKQVSPDYNITLDTKVTCDRYILPMS